MLPDSSRQVLSEIYREGRRCNTHHHRLYPLSLTIHKTGAKEPRTTQVYRFPACIVARHNRGCNICRDGKPHVRFCTHTCIQTLFCSVDYFFYIPCSGRTLEDTIGDKTVERLLVKVSSAEFAAKTSDSLLLGREVGNMYCASLYGGLASLFAT